MVLYSTLPFLFNLIRQDEGQLQQLKARAFLVDMEEGVIHGLLRGPFSSLFDEALVITDVSGSGNNWARGHEVYGELHGSLIADTVSRALEDCDSPQVGQAAFQTSNTVYPQAFLFVHSLGGGTGSGLGTKCLEMMADLHPQLARLVCAVSPGNTDDVITSPYNTALALRELRQHATCVLPVCNDSLSQVKGAHSVDSAMPFAHANGAAAQMIAHLTSSVRFSGPLDIDVLDLNSNLVPYRGLQFLFSAFSPLVSKLHRQQETHRSQEAKIRASQFRHSDIRLATRCSDLMLDILSPSHQLLDVHPKVSTCLASAFLLRGECPIGNIIQRLDRGSTRLGICSIPPPEQGVPTAHLFVMIRLQVASLLCLLNSCAIRQHFSRVLGRFMKLYSKRAHLHHYTEFTEKAVFDAAAESLKSLIEDYEPTKDKPADSLQHML
ncbi:tubulin epsilon chain [Cyclospora cayetanensis]|uniref:Tubulin epsilon chain n=1 Tax=Cyclospora cayetanensis TaxID=88456 RepID=A0A1D3CX84_9EIME|nr:tubulin epsilon chain [Cyclospora cayetanensis]